MVMRYLARMSAVEKALRQLNPRNIDEVNIFSYLVGQYNQIYTLLENTFKFRDGKSCFVLGPRGVGKSTLVNSALNTLGKEYEFFCIRLHGSFFRDDTLAIKEIARQLDWYLEKYNPDERDLLKRATATFEQASVTATMNVIIEILDRTRLSEEANTETGKLFIPIVFVIDEIERYTHNAKQTLLYNLFDMASSKTGGKSNSTTISVIGLSTRTTVREQLEKRVKSRFSQRIIQINKVKDLEQFFEVVYEMVRVEGEDAFNERIREYIHKGQLRKKIVENFYTIKDLNGIRNELIVFLTTESLDYKHLADYNNRNYEQLKCISESELKLLICCCRAKIRNNVDVVNYEMAFTEYYDLTLKERQELQSRIETAGMSLSQANDYTLSRDAMQVCWERLLELGLLQQTTQGCSVGIQLDDIDTDIHLGEDDGTGEAESVNNNVAGGVGTEESERDCTERAEPRGRNFGLEFVSRWKKL